MKLVSNILRSNIQIRNRIFLDKLLISAERNLYEKKTITDNCHMFIIS